MPFYLAGALILTAVWLALALANPNPPRKSLFMGSLFGVAAVAIAQLYALRDYWHPTYVAWPVNFEDFFYGLAIGGIAASAYEVAFRRRRAKLLGAHFQAEWFVGFIAFAAVLFPVLTFYLGLNSIVSHLVPPLVIAGVVFATRRDLVLPSLFAALAVTVVTAATFLALQALYPSLFASWHLADLSGFSVLGIPAEELLFAFALGLGGSHCYEFLFGERFELARRGR
ncbi:MAG TPA: lycopene cyclase domain-containing protein [Candidatus Paceibacterota bacterium]